MRKEFLIITFLIVLLANTTMAQTQLRTQENVYTNPLKVQFGDPFVLFSDGTYYMYGTGGGADRGFSAYSSKDLVNWKPEGQVYFHNNKNGWSDPNAAWGGAYWAPEVYEVKGKFYLFYSAQWKVNPAKEEENFKVGVAVSDKPTGPFVDLVSKPLFDPGYPIIDANVFFDTNGKSYLYYSRAAYKHPIESEIADQARKSGKYKEIEESWVYGVELKPDFSGVTGQPVLILRPPVGIVSGTGHNSIVYSPDGKEMFCVYHGRTNATGSERVVFIDRMKVKNGKITVYGPITQPQKKPMVSP